MNPSQPYSSRLPIVLSVALGLACLALLFMVVQGRTERAGLQRELSALQAQSAAARLKPPPSPIDDKTQRSTPQDPATAPPADSGTPAAAATSADKSDRKRLLNADAMAAMLKSPMMQKIMASQTSAITQMTYSHLMNHLQLAPEEREYLQGLLVEKQTNLQNLGMQLMNPSLDAGGREAILGQLTEAWKTGEEKIRSFLNDDADFAYYQTYSQQEPERREVGMFEASLANNDPLDAATSEALAKLQNDARKSFPFTVDFYDQQNFGNAGALNGPSVQRFLDEQAQFQAQVAEKAAGLLTPSRLEAFKQNQAAVRQMSTMQLNSIVQLTGGGR